MSRAVRRRIFLMRHGAVAYFDDSGRPVPPDTVRLTEEGRRQAEAARDLLAGIVLDRVIASGLPRTMETAAIVAPGREAEAWPELREIRGERLSSIPAGELEEAFVHAFRGVVPNEKRFLGGETIGELFDRVLPALDRLLADDRWDTSLLVLHGAVNRAVLSYALTGERLFLGRFEQAPGCLNVLDVDDEWVVRAVNVAATDLAHGATRRTTMESYWEQYRAGGANRTSLRAGPKADPLTVQALGCSRAQTSDLPHLSADTDWNVPFVNFMICSQWIGNWVAAPVFCRLPGSRNGLTCAQALTAFMIPARVGFGPACCRSCTNAWATATP